MITKNQMIDEVFENTTNILAHYCVPTLLHQKPATLVCFNKKSEQDKERIYRCFQSEAGQFACQCTILYENRSMVFLLIYQAELMDQMLFRNEVMEFMRLYGYYMRNTDSNAYLNHFINRYHDYWEKGATFPHELGIFLGYPLKDVEGFIINQGKNYLLSGFWKVYHDVPNALKTFETYRRLREEAINIIKAGYKLEDLQNEVSFRH